jgi:hypothetical protein
MSSPSPSLTLQTDMSSSQLSSVSKDIEDHPHDVATLKSYKTLSGEQILAETKDLLSEGIYYGAIPNLVTKGEFLYNKDIKGDVFVPKDKNKLSSGKCTVPM